MMVSLFSKHSSLIRGFSASFILLLIILDIFLVALKISGSPAKSIALVKRIRSRRQSLQGLPPVKKLVRAGDKFFISENIPGFPSRAFNQFIRAEAGRIISPGRKVPLLTVIIAITSRCRLRCRHCYEWENLSIKDRISSEDLRNIVKKVIEYGTSHVQFSGGEPIERFDDLIELIKYARRDADVWILTSGFGLTENKARLLKKAGLTGCDISIDHWDEAEHNKSRNNPESFNQALKAAANCRNAGLITAFSLCAFMEFTTSGNLMKYAELARRSGAGFIRLLEPRQAGRFKGKNIMLGNDQIKTLEEFYIRINTSVEYSAFPIVSYPGYGQRRSGCSGAGNRYLYIDSAGQIHACPFCQESAGNAVEDDLHESVAILRSQGCHEFALNSAD